MFPRKQTECSSPSQAHAVALDAATSPDALLQALSSCSASTITQTVDNISRSTATSFCSVEPSQAPLQPAGKRSTHSLRSTLRMQRTRQAETQVTSQAVSSRFNLRSSVRVDASPHSTMLSTRIVTLPRRRRRSVHRDAEKKRRNSISTTSRTTHYAAREGCRLKVSNAS